MNRGNGTFSGTAKRSLKRLFLLGTMPALLAGVLMASAARADSTEAGTVVFYDAGTKSSQTARIDADGNLTSQKTYVETVIHNEKYGDSVTLQPIWYPPVTAVGTRHGSRWLLAPAGTGLYEPVGVFSDGSLAANRGLFPPAATRLVGLQNTGGLVFCYDANAGTGATIRFNDDPTYAPDGSQRKPNGPYVGVSYDGLWIYRGFSKWSHVVGLNGGLLFFYDSQRKDGAIARVAGDGTYRMLNGFGGFAAWTHVVGVGSLLDPGLVLFWNANTGLAATCRVGADGSFTNLKVFRIDWPWTHVVGVFGQLEAGRVLLYDANSGLAETARVSADGSFTPLKVFNNFPVWTQVIGDSQ